MTGDEAFTTDPRILLAELQTRCVYIEPIELNCLA